MKNLSPIVKYDLSCLDDLQIDKNDTVLLFFSAHTSCMDSNTVSFSGLVIIFNNNESNNIYLSASISNFFKL